MRVLLVSLPFAPVANPSLGLSLLKAGLVREGHTVAIEYFNVQFLAEMAGDPIERLMHYTNISSDRTMCGDWIFSRSLFGSAFADRRAPRQIERMRRRYEVEQGDTDCLDQILGLERRAERFLDRCLDRVAWHEWDLVGLTSTFYQNVASFAFARRLAARWPDLPIAFGGANADGPMGAQVARSFDCLDFVVSGEADLSLPALVGCLESGRDPGSVGGVYARTGDRIVHGGPARPVTDLDGLPLPDFDDYFEQIDGRPGTEALSPGLVFESSRGCWWGAKHHCTFCGLNSQGMAFRKKSPERTLAEIEHLVDRYGVTDLAAVDNIVDMAYFDSFLPWLEERGLGLNLFYETKANLGKAQVAALPRAGVGWIQPGVESLSSEILALMRKGIRGIQNIQLLKWAREFDLAIIWNLLYGFPGESPAAYEEMARVMGRLVHLQPPSATASIDLERFSPYHEDAASFGITGVRPEASYADIYDLPAGEIEGLAYTFDFEFPGGADPDEYARPILEATAAWQAAYRHGVRTLTHTAGTTLLLVEDRRPGRPEASYLLRGLQKFVYEHLDAVRRRRAVARHVERRVADRVLEGLAIGRLLAGRPDDERIEAEAARVGASVIEPLSGLTAGDGELDALIELLEAAGLVLVEGDQLLALSIPSAGEADRIPRDPPRFPYHSQLGARSLRSLMESKPDLLERFRRKRGSAVPS